MQLLPFVLFLHELSINFYMGKSGATTGALKAPE